MYRNNSFLYNNHGRIHMSISSSNQCIEALRCKNHPWSIENDHLIPRGVALEMITHNETIITPKSQDTRMLILSSYSITIIIKLQYANTKSWETWCWKIMMLEPSPIFLLLPVYQKLKICLWNPFFVAQGQTQDFSLQILWEITNIITDIPLWKLWNSWAVSQTRKINVWCS